MTNLLTETIETLRMHEKTPEDVLFVTDGEASESWASFALTANKEYDNGYGRNEVSLGLKIVGSNWWLERGEYDGSEWWEFKQKPSKKKEGLIKVWDD